MSPGAHGEGWGWLEIAVTYCAVCLSGLLVFCPTWVIQLVVSESLNSDLLLLLCLLSATLHAMFTIVSPTITFSEKNKRLFSIDVT